MHDWNGWDDLLMRQLGLIWVLIMDPDFFLTSLMVLKDFTSENVYICGFVFPIKSIKFQPLLQTQQLLC